ncbi:MAG: N-acetyltransferase [Eubacterium sp.]|nr:N-acetyltransferase [Eubacterium sp.]
MLEYLGEERTKQILSSFECPQNKDVEKFIKDKAIIFSKQGISRTHLVYWYSDSEQWEKSKELVGYYTIASKSLVFHKKSVSNTIWKKAVKYCDKKPEDKKCVFSAPLIGQLSKNFAGGNDSLITGQELLTLALNKIKSVQNEIGGKFTYLECEDKPKLIDFYERNGFTIFGKRTLERDETDINGEYLIQLFKYIK